jgi:hypothetical protein
MLKRFILIELIFFVSCSIGNELNSFDSNKDIQSNKYFFMNLIIPIIVFDKLPNESIKKNETLFFYTKNPYPSITGNDLIFYCNRVREFYEIKINIFKHSINQDCEEGELSISFFNYLNKNNIYSGISEINLIVDNDKPKILSKYEKWDFGKIDLELGKIEIEFSENMKDLDNFDAYEFEYSNPEKIKIIKIQKVNDKKIRIYGIKEDIGPEYVKIKFSRLKDYANNTLEGLNEIKINIFGFRNKGKLAEARCNSSSIQYGENILITGGVNNQEIKDTIEVFDPKNNKSTLLDLKLLIPRFKHKTMKISESKYLVYGGLSSSNKSIEANPTVVTEFIDLIQNKVTRGPDLNVARVNFLELESSDGSLYIVAGINFNISSSISYLSSIEKLNKSLLKFDLIPVSTGDNLHTFAGTLYKEDLYLFGGYINRLSSILGYNYNIYKINLSNNSRSIISRTYSNYISPILLRNNDEIIVLAGLKSTIIQKFNIANSRLTTLGSLSQSLGDSKLFDLTNNYYIAINGIYGEDAGNTPLKKIIYISKDNFKVTEGEDIPEPKICDSLNYFENKIYIIGGSIYGDGYNKILGGQYLTRESSDSIWVYETF